MTEASEQRRRNHPSHEWNNVRNPYIESCARCGVQWDETPECEQPCPEAGQANQSTGGSEGESES